MQREIIVQPIAEHVTEEDKSRGKTIIPQPLFSEQVDAQQELAAQVEDLLNRGMSLSDAFERVLAEGKLDRLLDLRRQINEETGSTWDDWYPLT